MGTPRTDFRAMLGPLIRAKGIRATGRVSGVHHGSIGAWLRGSRGIPVRALEDLLQAMGLVVTLEGHDAGEDDDDSED